MYNFRGFRKKQWHLSLLRSIACQKDSFPFGLFFKNFLLTYLLTVRVKQKHPVGIRWLLGPRLARALTSCTQGIGLKLNEGNCTHTHTQLWAFVPQGQGAGNVYSWKLLLAPKIPVCRKERWVKGTETFHEMGIKAKSLSPEEKETSGNAWSPKCRGKHNLADWKKAQ